MAGDFVKICEVGDTFYKIKKDGTLKQITIVEVLDYGHFVYRDNEKNTYFNRTIRKSCFRTKQEAEEAVWKMRDIAEKRELLKEYERELNKKYGLGDHTIVK